MKKILTILILTPSLVFGLPTELSGFIKVAFDLIDLIIPILSGVIFIIFFYGIAIFILSQGDIVKSKIGKSYMIWSVVGIFLLVSLWGIIQIASNELGFGKITKPTLPTN